MTALPTPVVACLPCRFAARGCPSRAVAVFYMPAGCHCWPDPVQALCAQHAEQAESAGPITAIIELQDGGE